MRIKIAMRSANIVLYARPPFPNLFPLIRFLPAVVGASLLRCCISDRNPAFFAPPNSTNRVHEPPLRGYTVLCHQSLRSLRERRAIYPTGAILFLAVLLLHELHLDCGSILSVYSYIKFSGGGE